MTAVLKSSDNCHNGFDGRDHYGDMPSQPLLRKRSEAPNFKREPPTIAPLLINEFFQILT